MNGKLYQNVSDRIVVNKTLRNETSVTLHFKDDSNVINPTIYISRDIDMQNFNYIHVSGNIDRDYFIDSYEVSQQRYILHCHVDVLRTYKSSFLKEECIIAKNQNTYNLFLNDDRMRLYNKSRILTKPFVDSSGNPKGFLSGGSKTWTMLLTINGSGTASSNNESNEVVENG